MTITDFERVERCEYVVGFTQCCERDGHDGSHMFKCAGDHCPGLPWVASNTQHPTSCNVPPREREL